MPESDLLQAKERFIDFPKPEVPVVVLAGTLARKGHPIVDRNPTMWVPAEVTYDVERPKTNRRPSGG